MCVCVYSLFEKVPESAGKLTRSPPPWRIDGQTRSLLVEVLDEHPLTGFHPRNSTDIYIYAKHKGCHVIISKSLSFYTTKAQTFLHIHTLSMLTAAILEEFSSSALFI